MSQNSTHQNAELKLMTLIEPQNCGYLNGEKSNSVFIDTETPPTWQQYSNLSRLGFRRSGNHYYRPHCPYCNACIPCRVNVSQFDWRRRFKRILSRNSDLQATFVKPVNDEEHYQLYERYISTRHADGEMYPPSQDQYRDFIARDTGFSWFLDIRHGDELIACSLVDVVDDGLSAIYTFFAPEAAERGLGIYAVLQQIIKAKQQQLPYVYLGYWIKNHKKMGYKSIYQPLELFLKEEWSPFEQWL
ncbi:MAG: arginyltransferase [Oceanospirillaceae bacterium]|nr:arginyltransferase [Oceanospirillaceae bacterium]MCP5334075.1 arginyltransferase [Oceanospirillaceae bacterium]